MAALSKWACLPLLFLASFISLATAARIFPLDTDEHSSVSATSIPSDDLDWLPVTGIKRKLSVMPSQHETDDDNSSVSMRMDNTDISYLPTDPKWMFEKGEGVMSDDDVGTRTVVDRELDDKDSSFQHLSNNEIDELMDNLEDVGMDNSEGGFDDECDTAECGGITGKGGDGDIGRMIRGGIGRIIGGGGGGGIGRMIGGGGGGGIGRMIGGGGGGGLTGGGGGGHIGNIGWRWHWGLPWGGDGSKVAASNDVNPNTGVSGMTTDTATAPALMSN